jgi:hypothetical protein
MDTIGRRATVAPLKTTIDVPELADELPKKLTEFLPCKRCKNGQG